MKDKSKADVTVIGVVVPAYNSARYLSKLLKSIVVATKRQFECVVVNDGSTDNTIEIFFETVGSDPRFTLLDIPNGGVAAARNVGYGKLSEKVTHVTFMDADDAYIEGGLDCLIEHLLARQDVRAIHGLGTFEYCDSGVDRSNQYEQFGLDRMAHKWGIPFRISSTTDTTLESIILKSTMFPPGLVLVEQSLLNEVGLFSESSFIHHADDWHFMIRLALAGPIAFVPKPVLLYRRHESNAGAASTIPIACSNVWRSIYWSPENTASHRTRLFFSWKAKQIIDVQQRAYSFWRHKNLRMLMKLSVGIITCTFRWVYGAPSRQLERLQR